MLVRTSSEAGEIEHGERGDALQGLRLRGQGGPRGDGAAPAGRGDLKVDLPPEEALAALLESPFTRYPVYRDSLDEIIGDPARPRPLRRAARPRDRPSRDRTSAATGLHRPGDEGSRRAPRRVPQAESAHGGRRRRVRRDGRNRHPRGPARRDRRRDRGRIRPAGRVDRADRRHAHPHRRHISDRRLQRAVRHGDRDRGLPHDGRVSSSAQLGRAPEVGDEVADRRCPRCT